MGFVRTAEQQAIVDTAKTVKGDVRIEAYAGAAKTTTLREIAIDMPQTRFLYVAFNKKIQEDASATFPPNVTAKTGHSLAYGRTKMFENHWREKLNKRVRTMDYMHFLDIPTGMGATYVLAILDTVRYFEYSADVTITQQHIPYEVTSKAEESLEKLLPYEEKVEDEVVDKTRLERLSKFKSGIVEYAVRLWDLKTDPDASHVPIQHDTYLKLWQLDAPVIRGFDVILFDEAQDANAVILDIVMNQKIRKIYVGDSCQPSGTKVLTTTTKGITARTKISETFIEDLEVGQTVVSYRSSDGQFSFNRKVLGITKRYYEGKLIRVASVKKGMVTRYTPDHRCLISFEKLRKHFAVYLMGKSNGSFRVGVTKMAYERSASGPKCRLVAEQGEMLWILKIFKNKQPAMLEEALISFKFGIPQVLFVDNNNSLGFNQRNLNVFWHRIGNITDRAITCLKYYEKDIAYPLIEPGQKMFSLLRPATVRAINIFNGCELLPFIDKGDSNKTRCCLKDDRVPITVAPEQYKGYVYSMTVEKDHKYIGDNFVTYNCQAIYRFRGAIDALQQIKAEKEHYLTQSFRFGPKIAEIATAVLKDRGLKKPIRGYEKVHSSFGSINTSKKYTHIFRTNAGLLKEALKLSYTKSKVAVVGKIDGAIAKIYSAYFLSTNAPDKVKDPEIKQYDSWEELVDLSKKHDNFELIMITDFVTEHGKDIPKLLRQLDSSCTYPEKDADVILTTAHKAKGREFDQVKIDEDFDRRFLKDGEVNSDVQHEEINLLYVALTRAILKLEVSSGIQIYLREKGFKG